MQAFELLSSSFLQTHKDLRRGFDPMRLSRLAICCLLLLAVQVALASETEPKPPPEDTYTYDPSSLSSVLAYVTTDNETYVKDLMDFVAIPSISALPDHASDVLAAAGWLKLRMVTAGLENVQVLHTEGPQPVVSGGLRGTRHLSRGHVSAWDAISTLKKLGSSATAQLLYVVTLFTVLLIYQQAISRCSSSSCIRILLWCPCSCHHATMWLTPVLCRCMVTGCMQAQTSLPSWCMVTMMFSL